MGVSYKVIGRNVREARRKEGLTQEEAAELIKISTLHYGRLERGDRPVSLQQLATVAEVLNTTINELLMGASEFFLNNLPEKGIDSRRSIDHIAQGCSQEAQNLMLDLCTVVAQRDRFDSSDM